MSSETPVGVALDQLKFGHPQKIVFLNALIYIVQSSDRSGLVEWVTGVQFRSPDSWPAELNHRQLLDSWNRVADLPTERLQDILYNLSNLGKLWQMKNSR